MKGEGMIQMTALCSKEKEKDLHKDQVISMQANAA
jgi:hypothetical protein